MTIREIASIAGVSPAAVSLVINHKKGVSEETRQKVQSVIDEYGYSVAWQKRKIKRFRLMVIKFHTHGITEENQGFIASIIDRIESECRRFAFDLVMYKCEAQTAESTIRELMTDPPDGVIIIGTELSEEYYGILDLFSMPVMVLDNNVRYKSVDSLVMDNRNISATAVRYLYQLGHRDIHYFKFSLPIHNCDERYEGYLDELRKLGLIAPPPTLLGPTLNSAYDDMKALLKSGAYVPQGAVIADNDTVAIGAMKAIREAGYRIPEDVSIIGVDDIPFSAMTMPALTTMRISRATLGTLAVDMIRKRVKHPDWPSIHTQITGRLVVRNSTRPVNEGDATC